MNKYLTIFLINFLLFACSTKNVKYNYDSKLGTIILSPKKNLSHYLPKNFGYATSPSYLLKTGIHFPNINNDTANLNSITIKVKGSTTYNLKSGKSAHVKNDKYGSFKINIYDFNSVAELPTTRYLRNDTIMQLSQGEKEVILDLSNMNIPFGKNGIFITLEKFSENEYKNSGFVHGPSYGIIGVSKENAIIPYYLNQRIADKKWKREQYLIDSNNTYDVKITLRK